MTEQEKTIRLLLRQLKDIQAQADKIITGENSDETIETFARYSTELKSYILTHVESDHVKSFALELPEIDFSPSGVRLWQYLIIPFVPPWWLTLYKEYQEKKETIQEIGIVRGKYATLELLVRGLAN